MSAMLADGKENLHPNPSQRHDLSPNIAIGSDTNKSTLENNYIFDQLASEAAAARPLLFSEILFNNSNGNHFSLTCTDTNNPQSTDLSLR